MPVTFPAHQGLIVGLKLKWPRRFDGTALCIGAAAPDLAYALGPWLRGHSHDLFGLVFWAIPFSLLAALITRRWSATGIFANLPDLGPLRLRSYGVLVYRRPPILITVLSASLGAGSHVLVDAFTHRGRWGAELLGLDVEVGTLPILERFTLAGIAQYLGHIFGSVAFVAALVVIARRRLLEDWYGQAQVEEARSLQASRSHRLLFCVMTVMPTLGAAALAPSLGQRRVFLAIVAVVFSLLFVGAISALELRGSGSGLQRRVLDDGAHDNR